MVVISDKVKDSMDYDPVEFIIKSGTVERSIIPDGIYTYEKVAGKDFTFTIIERYYIDIVIVLELFLVDLKEIRVGTKYDVYISELLSFVFCNG